jgi:hypothetical protein
VKRVASKDVETLRPIHAAMASLSTAISSSLHHRTASFAELWRTLHPFNKSFKASQPSGYSEEASGSSLRIGVPLIRRLAPHNSQIPWSRSDTLDVGSRDRDLIV